MTHTWKIYDLKRVIADGVVSEVTYGCESNDGDFSTRKVGSFELEGSASDEGFVEFEDLNEADVLAWVTSNVDKSAIETSNETSITDQATFAATIEEKNGLPW